MAKTFLFFRTILNDVGISQEATTVVYDDKRGGLLMANAQQLTMCTCHIYIKYFALQDQVESDLTLLQEISTNENAADAFIKAIVSQAL